MRPGALGDPAAVRPAERLGAPVGVPGGAGRAALGAALLAATAGPLAARGGYLPAGRALFVVLAGAALVLAVALAPELAGGLLRSSPLVSLGGLAALGAASAAWTVAAPADALRWSALVAGYAAVAVVAGVHVRARGDARLLAGGLAVLAGLAGLSGILGVATFTEPFADRIDGTWRAGGTLEYPPALGLLQVSALPVLLTAMARRPRSPAAGVAAFGAAVAAVSLVLTGSRLHPLLAAGLLAMAVAWPRATVRTTRTTAIAAAGLVCAAAIAAHLLVRGELSAAGPAPGRLLALFAVPPLAAVAWRVIAPIAPAALLGAGALTLCAVLLVSVPDLGDRGLHGRDELWSAAVETAADRPLLGAGADAFYVASERHQEGAPGRFAHNLPLELLVELGVAGLVLALALYVSCARAVWLARRSPEAWLLGPAVAAFLLAGLLDWPWHMAGPGAVFAAALGGVIAHNR